VTWVDSFNYSRGFYHSHRRGFPRKNPCVLLLAIVYLLFVF
jgi:hypothetical protein